MAGKDGSRLPFIDLRADTDCFTSTNFDGTPYDSTRPFEPETLALIATAMEARRAGVVPEARPSNSLRGVTPAYIAYDEYPPYTDADGNELPDKVFRSRAELEEYVRETEAVLRWAASKPAQK